MKTVTLECGGKNPIVIFPDADLDAALEGVVRGMNFSFQGQSCGSTSRLIVHSDIHATSSSGSRTASRTCGWDCRTTMRRRSARW